MTSDEQKTKNILAFEGEGLHLRWLLVPPKLRNHHFYEESLYTVLVLTPYLYLGPLKEATFKAEETLCRWTLVDTFTGGESGRPLCGGPVPPLFWPHGTSSQSAISSNSSHHIICRRLFPSCWKICGYLVTVISCTNVLVCGQYWAVLGNWVKDSDGIVLLNISVHQ